MVFKAKNGRKWKHHWYWAFLHIWIEVPVLVASLISPNFSSYELSGQPRQKFSPKLECSSNPKMFFHSCTVNLLSTNSASEASMVKHVKFDHVLDTIFCWFWAESVQCEIVFMIYIFKDITIWIWLMDFWLINRWLLVGTTRHNIKVINWTIFSSTSPFSLWQIVIPKVQQYLIWPDFAWVRSCAQAIWVEKIRHLSHIYNFLAKPSFTKLIIS